MAVSCSRFWTKADKPLGFLAEPGEEGGQAVVIRVARLTLRLEATAWLEGRP